MSPHTLKTKKSIRTMRVLCVASLFAVGCVGAAQLACGNYPDHLSRSDVVAAKGGIVVDEKGSPLANVTLIATYRAGGTKLSGTQGGCVARRLVTSDAMGHFDLPDVSDTPLLKFSALRSFLNGLGIGSSSYDWSLMAFKDGYIEQGAQTHLRSLERLGGRWPLWHAPKIRKHFFGIEELETIVLEPSSFTPDQTIIYAGQAHDFSRSCDDIVPPTKPTAEYLAFDAAVIKSVENIPCSLDSEYPITATAAQYFLDLSGGVTDKDDKFFWTGQGDKDTFYTRMYFGASGGHDFWAWHDTNAGTLCWAQGRRENRP